MVRVEIGILDPNTYLVIRVEERELEYYDDDYEVYVTVSMSAEDAESYREYATSFIDSVFNDRRQYRGGSSTEWTTGIWSIRATYDDGSTMRIVAEHGYPDDWDEFLERTNALVGFDLLRRGDGG
jgi:hypothetical protein